MTRTSVLLLILVIAALISVAASFFALQRTRARLQRWEDPPLSARWFGPEDAPRVAFLGASITHGWPLEESFPDLRTLNAGAGWQFVGQQLLRFRADVLAHDVDVVVVEVCGTNLVRSGKGLFAPLPSARVRDALLSIADLARAHGVVPVLCTPLPVSRDYAGVHAPENLQEELLALRSWMMEDVADQGVVVADLYAALADEEGFLPDDLSEDGLHPDTTCYPALSQVLRPVLEDALSSEQAK